MGPSQTADKINCRNYQMEAYFREQKKNFTNNIVKSVYREKLDFACCPGETLVQFVGHKLGDRVLVIDLCEKKKDDMRVTGLQIDSDSDDDDDEVATPVNLFNLPQVKRTRKPNTKYQS